MRTASGSRLFALAIGLAGMWAMPISAATRGGCAVSGPIPDPSGACFLSGPIQDDGYCGGNLGSIGPSCWFSNPDLWKGGGTAECRDVTGRGGWAVVDLRFDRKSDLPPTKVTVVVASSAEFAEFARQLYMATPVDNPQLFPPEVEMLLAAPGDPCVNLWATMPDPAPVLEGAGVEAPELAYFQAETNGQRIVSIDVLESEANERDLVRLLAYAKENLEVTIWSQDSPQVPLKVFGSLVVSKGQVSFVVLAASRLHQP
jgi:hypothetical protein